MLFKEFGGVNAFPLCLDTQQPEKIIETCVFLAPAFGGINLEDISSPRCVEIEERLTALLEIPVFHDDQHGTAIVVLAALQNALKIVQKDLRKIRVTLCGSGAAGQAVAKLLKLVGVEQIVACDKQGAISAKHYTGDNPVKRWIAENTNPERLSGRLSDVIRGADVFIGVSAANVLREDDVQRMAKDPVLFVLANPDPEIDPDVAAPYAAVLATGRSDYPNQINNVLCFPGFFRGLLDVRAPRVIDAMKIAAAQAIAGVIPEKDLLPDYIVPSVFDRRVASAVAKAVAKTALDGGIARREHKPGFRISP